MIYAGIGSRETPRDVQDTMTNIAQLLAMHGATLRSGHADGADRAFELGCDFKRGAKEIFIALNADRQPAWFNHARKYHPNWKALQRYVQQLHARNSAIMLGEALNNPVDFVVCWTPGGGITGGTGQALRIALDYSIPVFNLYEPDAQTRMWVHVAQLRGVQ